MKHFHCYEEIASLVTSKCFDLRNSPKHVAVLCIGSEITKVFTNRYAFHAEELAVQFYANLPDYSKKRRVRLYVARISEHSPMSRPCRHCCAMLRRFPQIRVFYTDKEGNWVEEQDFSNPHISIRRQTLGYCRA